MTTESQLQQFLLNHNAFTKNCIIDTDNLGAGGSKEKLVVFNTQKNFTELKTKAELIEVIKLLGDFERFNNQYFEEPNPIFYDEFQRLKNGGTVNHQFMKYLDIHGWLQDEFSSRKYVTGQSLREGDLN